MSISLATMGMFQTCCGTLAGGGGAPPYKQNLDEPVKPRILVKKVETEDIESLVDKIKVTLVDTNGGII